MLPPDISVPNPLVAWGTDYQNQVNELLNDPWLSKKVNRERRWRENLQWLRSNLPEVFEVTGKRVVDIGPGPGEAIEILKRIGHSACGYDAISGDGGMGDAYLSYSKLMHFRQFLMVHYVERDEYRFADVDFVIMRGSIEQVFSDCMIGQPHHIHHKASELKWNIREAEPEMERFLGNLYDGMSAGGIAEIAANGSQNNQGYAEMLEAVATDAGFRVTVKSPLNHRLKKL